MPNFDIAGSVALHVVDTPSSVPILTSHTAQSSSLPCRVLSMTLPASRPPSSSPSRPVEAQFEVLYNTAVQSFVRRDHSNAQASLARLLKLLKTQRRSRNTTWYDLRDCTKEDDVEGWLIKTLKLFVSSHASLYTDPPSTRTTLSVELRALLPPSSPDVLLAYVHKVCADAYFLPLDVDKLLPPPLLSTLLLAALKLSLPYAHRLVEEWLSQLPDSFFLDIPPHVDGILKQKPEEKKRVEAAREGYLKVVELFVGEVLAREGEWEMARGLLEGEMAMGTKRKEVSPLFCVSGCACDASIRADQCLIQNLYRHLRALQTKPRSSFSSPANSAVLTLPADVSPSPSPKPNGRSRSSSSSSSSSERTARPNTANGHATPTFNSRNGTDRKGKGRSNVAEVEEEKSESSVPSKIYVNHPVPSSRTTRDPSSSRVSGMFVSALASLHASLGSFPQSDWLTSTLRIPIPIIILLVTFLSIRRRFHRPVDAAPASVVAAAGTATLAAQAMDDVRERLRRARGRGLLDWVGWWLRWWAARFAGIWKLGTTVTYV